jgi:hypothetical protein
VSKERKPLLEVAELAPERPFLLLEENRYDLRLTSEFSAREHADFTRDVREFDGLWGQETRNRADGKRMEQLLDRLFDKVVVDPKTIRADLGRKLTPFWKREVVLTFQNAPLLMQVLAAQAEEEAKTETEPETEPEKTEQETPGNSSTTES